MKNEDKKIYLVTGSHDGQLGVYSNVKYAYQKCEEYLSSNEVKTSYTKALEGCKSGYAFIDTEEYGMSCSIFVMYLNN
jgi:hypothetical protein